MKVIPTANGVIIKITGEQTTEGGIIVDLGEPTGVVVAVGPGAHNLTDGSRLDMQVKVGDIVLVEPNRSMPLVGYPGYMITNEELIVAIYPPKTDDVSNTTSPSPRKSKGKRSK